MSYVYRHIRHDTNKVFYVGIGSDNTYKRATCQTSRNKYWRNITAITDFSVEIMIDDIPFDEATKKEVEFIAIYGRQDRGGTLCNMTDGGEGTPGRVLSNATKMKMSISLIGKKKSLQHRIKCGEANTRRIVSNETKERMSLSQIERYKDPKEREKMRSLIGSKRAIDVCEVIAKAKYKLSFDDVARVIMLRKNGHTYGFIAENIGTNKRTVSRIVKGESYKYIQE